MTDVFVYGTLMGGQVRGGLLAGFERRKASVRGTLFSMPAGYPALQLEGEGRVHGELVVGVEEARLGILDLYEGTDQGLYQRVRLPVLLGLRQTEAWAYVMESPRLLGGRPIASGRFRALRTRDG